LALHLLQQNQSAFEQAEIGNQQQGITPAAPLESWLKE
jgi:hypothetical protein